jgi:hypothetical protein
MKTMEHDNFLSLYLCFSDEVSQKTQTEIIALGEITVINTESKHNWTLDVHIANRVKNNLLGQFASLKKTQNVFRQGAGKYHDYNLTLSDLNEHLEARMHLPTPVHSQLTTAELTIETDTGVISVPITITNQTQQ